MGPEQAVTRAMEDRRLTKRECVRFAIPGMVLNCRPDGFFGKWRKFGEDLHPVLDLSCGGVRFLSQRRLNRKRAVAMQLLDPNGRPLAFLRGRVVRVSPAMGESYLYQVGVQFNPFGRRRRFNPPDCLEQLRVLEKRFLEEILDP